MEAADFGETLLYTKLNGENFPAEPSLKTLLNQYKVSPIYNLSSCKNVVK
jgi:hypothetical protein